VAFLFLVAGSIRLARFNTAAADSRHFMGLPIPGGAGGIALLVLVSPEPVQHPLFIPVVLCFVLALSLLMVSNLPYRSFKDLNLRRQWPAPTLFLLAIVFSLVTWDPRLLSILAGLYILSAPLTVLTRRVRGGRPSETAAPSPTVPSTASTSHGSSESDPAAG
jgi:CDP-diacylglycerol--serine O-phosphatidyltransferase